MTGVYDDVVEKVSEMLSKALLEREQGLDALDVDSGVRALLRDVGLRTTQEVVDMFAEQAVQSAKAEGFIVNRSAEVGVGCLYGELRVSSPHLRRAKGETDRPVRELGLKHLSTDAHALRRYVDDTWKAEFKMLNGIRFWCIDRESGQTIHLGGEYTWGDCREVARRMEALVARLIPTGELAPQVVCITDGMPWIRDHVYPVLPDGTCFILDFYHLTERLSEYANAVFGAKTHAARRWVRQVITDLTGKRPYKKKKHAKRKGHRKKPRGTTDPYRTVHPSKDPHGPGEQLMWKLIEEQDCDALTSLSGYVAANLDRIDYSVYRQRGMQIGSGAMESLNRTASQMRLKLAGARWTPRMAIAVLNARLMLLADRWQAFWSQANLAEQLAAAFNTPTAAA